MLVTESKKVGQIGPHSIYTITSTALIPIASSSSLEQHGITSQDRVNETRYKSLLSTLDVTENFYFSYTYDLTRSLQSNMSESGCPPCTDFIWNHYLIQNASDIEPIWFVNLIHGYFEERRLLFSGGKPLSLFLLSRKCTKFAGTRYLKRGLSAEGYCANDVETEQICHDRDQVDVYDTGVYTSYSQYRASIPLFWTQEPNAMVARPNILIQIADPTAQAMRLHFQRTLERHGAPCICLNLIRLTEPIIRETRLGLPFREGVEYLNKFAVPNHQIEHIEFDFKTTAKDRTLNVAEELGRISAHILNRTAFFHSGLSQTPGFRQSGICRSNCIDSLDRTNAAQYCIGKVALGRQLYFMGLLSTRFLPQESPLVKLLLDMYERMGDCLAMQYGGSQMHRQIKRDKTQIANSSVPVLYRLRTPNKPKEILVSLLRHYQNSFQDKDKQDAYNLFLGVFRPLSSSCCLWDISSDFYLHNSRRSLSERLKLADNPVITPYNWTQEFVNRFNARRCASVDPPILCYSGQAASDSFFFHKYDLDSVTLFDEEFERLSYESVSIQPSKEFSQQNTPGVVARILRNLYPRNNDLEESEHSSRSENDHKEDCQAVHPLLFGSFPYNRVLSDSITESDLAITGFRFCYPFCLQTHSHISDYTSSDVTSSVYNAALLDLPGAAIITGLVLPDINSY
uniref:SAC domain-containing protein n=1 Tax=Spongospora subterranea TaxID=70186 RepID=A0A0H5QU10_9EUKA|eukprot:CRZ05498.1 hypothetical protein [Spongospora subterranea]